jgi:dipeptidyl aminopeptidase/acylaminoacyl peptidase
MASLLPTLDPCFKASVSMAAVTDWHSFHTTTNIPTFDQLFLDADPFSQKGGKYLERSPIMNAGKFKTPVLQTAGSDDLAVPSSQAVQYHQACLQKGVESAIAIYPGEGHGVRKFPALIDLLVRAVGWFDRFMPA